MIDNLDTLLISLIIRGKANLLEQELHVLNLSNFVLECDNIRDSLNKDLDPSALDGSKKYKKN